MLSPLYIVQFNVVVLFALFSIYSPYWDSEDRSHWLPFPLLCASYRTILAPQQYRAGRSQGKIQFPVYYSAQVLLFHKYALFYPYMNFHYPGKFLLRILVTFQ
jgi:hypothetical protein